MYACGGPIEPNCSPPFKKCKYCTFLAISNLLFLKHSCRGRFKCPECHCHLASKGSLKRHMQVKHDSSQEWYHCQLCPYKTLTKHYMLQHNFRKHAPTEDQVWFRCDLCNYKTQVKIDLMRHTRRRHKPLNEEHKVQCEICLLWLEKTYIKLHISRKHTDAREHKCALCEKVFGWKRSLDRHTLQAHSQTQDEEQKVQCQDCALWVNKTYIKVHMANKHTVDKQVHKCGVCLKAFDWKGSLRRHTQRAHLFAEDKRWHQCKHCPYKTMDRSYLRLHILRKHNEADGKCHKCDLCDYKTVYASILNRHVLSKHSSETFKCNDCGVQFKNKPALKVHIIRKHTTDEAGRLLKCYFCEYTHVYKTVIEAHMSRTHIEYKVKCGYCDVICKNEHALKDHVRRMKHQQ